MLKSRRPSTNQLTLDVVLFISSMLLLDYDIQQNKHAQKMKQLKQEQKCSIKITTTFIGLTS